MPRKEHYLPFSQKAICVAIRATAKSMQQVAFSRGTPSLSTNSRAQVGRHPRLAAKIDSPLVPMSVSVSSPQATNLSISPQVVLEGGDECEETIDGIDRSVRACRRTERRGDVQAGVRSQAQCHKAIVYELHVRHHGVHPLSQTCLRAYIRCSRIDRNPGPDGRIIPKFHCAPRHLRGCPSQVPSSPVWPSLVREAQVRPTASHVRRASRGGRFGGLCRFTEGGVVLLNELQACRSAIPELGSTGWGDAGSKTADEALVVAPEFKKAGRWDFFRGASSKWDVLSTSNWPHLCSD
jgi:hypothetical protein